VNDNKSGRNNHRPSGNGSFSNRPNTGTVRRQSDPGNNPKRSYERYMALARAAALTGDVVETENYYQHAEHFFRVMKETQTRT
jgi:hypothetical protein